MDADAEVSACNKMRGGNTPYSCEVTWAALKLDCKVLPRAVARLDYREFAHPRRWQFLPMLTMRRRVKSHAR